jgi:hypothetical protein
VAVPLISTPTVSLSATFNLKEGYVNRFNKSLATLQCYTTDGNGGYFTLLRNGQAIRRLLSGPQLLQVCFAISQFNQIRP